MLSHWAVQWIIEIKRHSVAAKEIPDDSEIPGVLIKQECLVQAGRKFECWMLKKTPRLAVLRADISHRANHG